MSLHEYEASRRLAAAGEPFYGLIMAAMRRADSQNLVVLRLAFPKQWRELEARYQAPGGVLPTDVQIEAGQGGVGDLGRPDAN